jgi:peptidoglycan-associated lipoprotein
MRTTMLAALGTLTLTLGLGCASAEKKPDPKPVAKTDAPAKRDAAERKETKLTAAEKDDDTPPTGGPVFFQFDSAELLPEGRDTLTRMATWLKAHPETTLTLEGHCDERGTEEYNLSLGQKRAEVMKSYLERLGVSSGQLKAISYGELKPAVDGSDEDAWAQNRRGEVKLSGAGRAG